MEAIAASVFALDGKGRILSLGSVRLQGTLYPVSLLDGKLMVAGHQFIRIYSIRGDVEKTVQTDPLRIVQIDPSFFLKFLPAA